MPRGGQHLSIIFITSSPITTLNEGLAMMLQAAMTSTRI
jgi:hypothetical protein